MKTFFTDRHAPPPWIVPAGLIVVAVVTVWMVMSALLGSDPALNQSDRPAGFEDAQPVTATGDGATGSALDATTGSNAIPALDDDLVRRAAITAVEVAVGGEPPGPVGVSYQTELPVPSAVSAAVADTETVRNDSNVAAVLVTVDIDTSTGETQRRYYTVVFATDTNDWYLGLVSSSDIDPNAGREGS